MLYEGQGRSRVEFFSSPTLRGREIVEFETDGLVPTHPWKGLRCFVELDGGTWAVGRVEAPLSVGGNIDEYQVTYDGGRGGAEYPSAKQVFVRRDGFLADPVDFMRVRALHSPESAARRRAFVRETIRQRRLSRGLTALLSSNIEVHRHQVEIADRVLNDPIQRYLLADEVGLGKTIEAGIIIRQYLIDDARARVTVLVPDGLESQWTAELHDKFLTHEWRNAVVVRPFSAIREVGFEGFGMLVVDEVHNLVASGDEGTLETLRTAAQRVPRLLLLSATPMLHNEDVFLGMLNLLDPDLYPLDDVEGFRQRIRSRIEFANQLQLFDESQPLFLLGDLAEAFVAQFQHDEMLAEHVDRLRELVDAAEPSADDTARLVRQIRAHLSETYRVLRRVLRTRRHSPLAKSFPVRGRRLDDANMWNTTATAAGVEPIDLDDWLERWLIAFGTRATTRPLTPDEVVAVSGLLDRLQTMPSIALTFCELWSGVETCDIDDESLKASAVSQAELSVLRRVKLTETEADLIAELCGGWPADDGFDQRWIERQVEFLSRLPACSLVFCGFDAAARALTDACARSTSANAGRVVALTASDDVARTLSDLRAARARMVLCGHSLEEGFNAQFVPSVVMLHVPWSPSRLEQRIGRADRFGAGEPVTVRVPTGMARVTRAWLSFLRDGFGVFESSIASLQHVVDRTMSTTLGTLMTRGVSSWEVLAHEKRSELEAEKREILALEMLESIEVGAGDRERLFDDVREADRYVAAFEEATLGWLAGGRLDSIGLSKSEPNRIRFPHANIRMGVDRDLVSHYLHIEARDVLDLTFGGANDSGNVTSARPGSRFVRRLEQLTAADDLGQTYGVIRTAVGGSDRLVAQFDVRVDSQIPAVRELVLADPLVLQQRVATDTLFRIIDSLVAPYHSEVLVGQEVSAAEMTVVGAVDSTGDMDVVRLETAHVASIEAHFGIEWSSWWDEARRVALASFDNALDLPGVRSRALDELDRRESNLHRQVELRRHVDTDRMTIAALEKDLQVQLDAWSVARRAIEQLEPIVESVGAIVVVDPKRLGVRH